MATSNDANNYPLLLRKRPAENPPSRVDALADLVVDRDEDYIYTINNDRITDLDLYALAAHIQRLDIRIIKVLIETLDLLQDVDEDDYPTTDHDGADLTRLKCVLSKLERTRQPGIEIHAGYLKNDIFIEWWQMFRSVVDTFASEPLDEDDGLSIFAKKLDGAMVGLVDLIQEAQSRGQLSMAETSTIKQRVLITDRILRKLSSTVHINRKSMTCTSAWLMIAWGDLEVKTSRPQIQAKLDRSTAATLSSSRITLPAVNSRHVIWLTWIFGVVATVLTVGPGFQYSPHEPGKTTDADFFFLVQSCSMSLLSLSLLTIALVKGRKIASESSSSALFTTPSQSWWRADVAVVAVAYILTLMAPTLYITVPTEWSAVCNALTSLFLALVTLQVVLQGQEQNDGMGEWG